MVGLKQMVFVHLFPPVLHVLACARDLFFPSWSQPGKLSVDSRKLCSIPSSAVGSRCIGCFLPSSHLSLSLWLHAGDPSAVEHIPALPWGGAALTFLLIFHFPPEEKFLSAIYRQKRKQPVSLSTGGFFLPVDMMVATFRAVIH